MNNFQRAIALRAFYEGALYVIGSSIATYRSSLRESVITKDAIDILKKSFKRIPQMYEKFFNQLEDEKIEEAKEQIDFVIKSLEDVLKKIDEYKEMLESHENDVTITAEDFASLQKLEGLAEEQLAEMQVEKELFEKHYQKN